MAPIALLMSKLGSKSFIDSERNKRNRGLWLWQTVHISGPRRQRISGMVNQPIMETIKLSNWWPHFFVSPYNGACIVGSVILLLKHILIYINWCYCFIGIKRHNVTSYWSIFFSIRLTKLILTISLNEIKGKMFNLLIMTSIILLWSLTNLHHGNSLILNVAARSTPNTVR